MSQNASHPAIFLQILLKNRKMYDIMILNEIWSLVTKILDICIIWAMFYFLFKNLKNNVKMILIFKGVLLIILIILITKDGKEIK